MSHIVLSVSESLGAGCCCNSARLYLRWWGWLQPSQKKGTGRNIIGHRAIVKIPGQRGGNITMCAAVSQQSHRHANLGPYNIALLITFHAALVCNWFIDHPQFIVLYLQSYSPFLNPIEEGFFSAWRWKVYDRHPLACNGGYMWWRWCGGFRQLDPSLQKILSPLFSQGEAGLRCRCCGAVARPK